MIARLLIYTFLGLFTVWFFNVGLERLMTPPADLADIPSQQQTHDNTPRIRPLTPEMADAQAAEALNAINRIRQSLQLNPLKANVKLAEAAKHHARYLSHHNVQSHQQPPGLAGFSGETPRDRAEASGYQSPVSEVIAFNQPSPYPMVDDLMSAIYHRLGLLNMTQDQIGLGVAGDGDGDVKSVLVGVMGNAQLEALCEKPSALKPGARAFTQLCASGTPISKHDAAQAMASVTRQNPKLIVWPKSGATVPPVFYEESPDPLPECNVSGYPVHLQVNPIFVGRIHFQPDTFTLTRLDDHDPTHTPEPVEAATVFSNRTDPNRTQNAPAADKDQWIAFFPQQRLDWNRRYQAQIQYTENGKTHTMRWNFFTEQQPGLVTSDPARDVPIRVGQTRTLYFPPENCQQAKTVQLRQKIPRGVKVQTEFIDGETLQVKLLSAPFGGAFELIYVAGHQPIKVRFDILQQAETE
ncbi:MAG: CAP domain-containing protein [Hydrogenovibrio sp.]